MQGLEPHQGAAAQLGQAVDQPAPVYPHERSHVGDRADTKQIESNLLAVGVPQALAERRRQHIGQPHPRQAPIGGSGRGALGMEQGQVRRQRIGNRVVVREDRLDAKGLGPLQGLKGRHPVVDGHQQGDPLLRQLLHHGGVEAVAVIHAAGDRRDRPGAKALQHPHQQGRAGHSVGVVVAADRHRFPLAAGALQPRDGLGQVGEVTPGRRCRLRIQQGGDGLRASEAPAAEQRQ